ncbi:putative endonuclease [Agreia pratensis]|uniref:Putative endonuclease n=2 Tax=Agreia pratensis TaxID=150121 RepID=A0A1X7IVP7_9MICO|nr:putative endonuclease [Agreia pratensis]
MENSNGSRAAPAIIIRMPHVYILRCSDGSYYVGSTWQLDARVEQHTSGHGAEYTKRRLPVELVFSQEYDRVDEAFAMEKRIQGWSRAKREALISGELHRLPGLSKKVWKRRE